MSDDIEKKDPESVSEQVRSVVGKAQEETGKLVGSLVKEGEKFRDQTLKLAGATVGEMKGRVEEVRGMVEGVKTKAVDTLDNLEQLFEDRVARALKRLGVPTRDDLQDIAKRLEEINGRIKSLADERAAATASAGEKDDLKLITGIGPVLEGKLNAAGIDSYRQIAVLTDADIERLETEAINLSGRIHRDDWVGQAKELHAKKYGEQL
ncbi:MAG TPA: phasin family protein [Candidatus Competibacteraceae bacterium]|nr:phasin family protein [Candidatus Competibacteraceae bacterium]HQD55544.1 phasin family protein [Candidatus Competibacteraceae bacterium]